MAWPRHILHVDMDAFFAAVEQLDRPELRGKPVLVGHDGPRGVVAAASYEARRFGCHSAQPMVQARRRCPHAVIVPVRGERYRAVSEQVFAIFAQFSPRIEPLSIDEAFLDVTGCERLLGPPQQIARRIKETIVAQLQLTASVGVAPNKFLAKLASDLNKPDGLTVFGPAEVQTIMPALPVSKIWGVGPVTAARLSQMGIATIGDLRAKPLEALRRALGDEAEHFQRLAWGQDERPVVCDHEAKSVGHEQTFAVDIADVDEVRKVLLEQVEQVARRLRRHQLLARGVALKIRYGDFQTISRSSTLDSATSATSELWQAAKALFDRWSAESFQPVRLIGMTAERLSAQAGQLDLFAAADREKQSKLDELSDRIVAKYGHDALKRGGPMG